MKPYFSPVILFTGHDCSIRLWNLESKTCIQEFTAHRKKFEESIHDVAFHPSKCYIASAGADALAKVFVWRGAACPSTALLSDSVSQDQGPIETQQGKDRQAGVQSHLTQPTGLLSYLQTM